MSRVLPVVVLLVVLALCGGLTCGPGGLWRPPPLLRARQLAAHPEAYAGEVVRVRTAGFEAGATPFELVYRPVAGQAPAVVLHFALPVPAPRPAVVEGTVAAAGPPVTVTDCRRVEGY